MSWHVSARTKSYQRAPWEYLTHLTAKCKAILWMRLLRLRLNLWINQIYVNASMWIYVNIRWMGLNEAKHGKRSLWQLLITFMRNVHKRLDSQPWHHLMNGPKTEMSSFWYLAWPGHRAQIFAKALDLNLFLVSLTHTQNYWENCLNLQPQAENGDGNGRWWKCWRVVVVGLLC